jgi:hypothetical protein
VGSPEIKSPLGGPRRRWEDNIKMDVRERERERGWVGIDWIDLAQDRGQWEGSCEHVTEPLGSINCCEILE